MATNKMSDKDILRETSKLINPTTVGDTPIFTQNDTITVPNNFQFGGTRIIGLKEMLNDAEIARLTNKLFEAGQEQESVDTQGVKIKDVGTGADEGAEIMDTVFCVKEEIRARRAA